MRARRLILVLVAAVVMSQAKAVTGPAKAGPYVRPARAGLFVPELRAQEPQQPTFRTEANYVRVDVYPTSNGVPVTDLQKDDFEVIEEGAPQTIDAFEHVMVAGNVPQETRREPTTVAESRAMLENPRARVFVIFLDYYHVDVAGSRNMRDTLVNALDRFLGPEDLFAVMTPEMSARDLSFARRSTTTRGMLEKYWIWGERDQLIPRDPQDDQYRMCFGSEPEIAEEMIERRREKLVLDALQDVVRSLRGAREERKAILTISNGWRLFRPSDTLQRVLGGRRPPDGLPPVGIDPRTGRITTDDKTSPPGTADRALCDRDRMALARIDIAQQLRDIGEEANRANATFYPLDPRGLAVFDEPIMKLGTGGAPPPTLPPSVDRARLVARLESLRALAADTDGMAIVNTNDLEGGFRRIVADLSSYYLLGYYSTRKMDGRFHSIRVRVKRPGVQVRARRGYLAPSAAEVTAAANRAKANTASALDPAFLESKAVEAALAPLNSQVRERSLYLQAVSGWRPGGTAGVWAVGEVSVAPVWKAGADVDVMLVGKGGETIEAQKVQVAAGTRHFSAAFTPPGGLTLATTRSTCARAAAGSTWARSSPRSSCQSAPHRSRAMRSSFARARRPATGKCAPLTSASGGPIRLGVDMPAAEGEPAQARLLGRNGQPLPLPVTAAVRDDPDGSRWQTARVSLAPLAPGDYILEMITGAERNLVGFRIVP